MNNLDELKKAHRAAEDRYFSHANDCDRCGSLTGGYCDAGRELRNESIKAYNEFNAASGMSLGPACPPVLKERPVA